MTRIALAVALVALLLTACTRENKEFCCTSAADCASVGVSDDHRDCNEGLACVDHSCSPASCATEGCSAAAPTCDVTIDVCAGCTSSTECTRFPTTSVCEPTSGSCVACLGPSDCTAASPVCDGNACRGCRLDSECSSGACADDGSCVPESEIVYLAPQGTDVAPCSKPQPCRGASFGTQQTTNTRDHIVFASGTYTFGNSVWTIGSGLTSATSLTIHGGGATLVTNNDDGFVAITMPTKMRDLEIINTSFCALGVGLTTATVENVKILGGSCGLYVTGSLTLRHSSVRTSSYCGIQLGGGLLAIDGVTVSGGLHGVCTSGTPAMIDFTNLLVFGTSGAGLDLLDAHGTITFSTVTATGLAGTGTEVTAIRCPPFGSIAVTSSIAWTPNLFRPVVENCVVSNSIVGPTQVLGGTNQDPLFTNPDGNNFHLNGGSPAVDMANGGPARDFEGEARPKGARFDWGADEAQ